MGIKLFCRFGQNHENLSTSQALEGGALDYVGDTVKLHHSVDDPLEQEKIHQDSFDRSLLPFQGTLLQNGCVNRTVTR